MVFLVVGLVGLGFFVGFFGGGGGEVFCFQFGFMSSK